MVTAVNREQKNKGQETISAVVSTYRSTTGMLGQLTFQFDNHATLSFHLLTSGLMHADGLAMGTVDLMTLGLSGRFPFRARTKSWT